MAALLAGALWTAPDLHALTVSLARADVERALNLARQTAAERARFHAPYIVAVDDASVEQVQIITEFRRYVLAGEEHLARGDWMFTQGVLKADDATGPFRGRVTVVARLRFSPLNAYVDLPRGEIAIDGGPVVQVLDSRMTPLTSAPFRVGRGRDAGTSLLGAIVEIDVDAAAVGQSRRGLTVRLDGRDLKRVEFDFARVE